ncbi:MAG TPA: 23S rRNA (adenine(2030)-N(6))-methyltransferase RlmJ, partial [Xanthomonadales bacterium]|nr:23S rRNA (adenine(2030)-N(6))-methyltransferase RlmJ [Xanthomonadales bacterium]
MLSYRHSFHAGNFADVLKHIVLIEILQYLKRKDSAFDYIDSHAGAGLFDLHSGHAEKLAEYRHGIARLMRSDLPALTGYLGVISTFNQAGELNFYPGSPVIAQQLLRRQDRATFYELHPTDHELLQQQMAGDGRIRVFRQDGLAALPGLMPPRSRRGLVLIDPSYEIKTDYQDVVKTLVHAHKKFATGIFVIWYPVIERSRSEDFIGQIQHSGIRDIQRFELAVRPDSPASGMTAAGLVVVNPP